MHALTEQLETMEYQWWLKEVRSLPTSRYDRWAFECCNVFSQQVMLSTECNGTHGQRRIRPCVYEVHGPVELHIQVNGGALLWQEV